MSKELANLIEADLSAPAEAAKRARDARTRSQVLDSDWVTAIELYNTQANRDPKRFARYPSLDLDFQDKVTVRTSPEDISSTDERQESATSR